MPIKSRSILSGHPCWIPYLIGIESEKLPLTFSLAEKLEKNIWMQLRRVANIPSLDAVE